MKDLFAKRASAIERGLQIPILDTSELQIRWNGTEIMFNFKIKSK